MACLSTGLIGVTTGTRSNGGTHTRPDTTKCSRACFIKFKYYSAIVILKSHSTLDVFAAIQKIVFFKVNFKDIFLKCENWGCLIPPAGPGPEDIGARVTPKL